MILGYNHCRQSNQVTFMTLLLRYSSPDVPKVVGSSRKLVEYTIPVAQSVHHDSAKGSPPSVSFTISWALVIRKG